MITKTEKTMKIVIDLDGEKGNAFALLGLAKSLCDQLDIDWETFKEEATSSNYKKLILTFDRYFGSVVELQTTQEELLNLDETLIEVESRMNKIYGRR